jgi:hypothetical protein
MAGKIFSNVMNYLVGRYSSSTSSFLPSLFLVVKTALGDICREFLRRKAMVLLVTGTPLLLYFCNALCQVFEYKECPVATDTASI